MFDWVLPIFPEGGLASSVITTVWVGVWVVAWFNLRFGWVFSGLVVPGYLVPLMIVKPFAAAVVVLEAAVTYVLVYVFSERLSSGRSWSSLFGRDRFMGLVLASILVRLVFDGWALPALGTFMNEHLGIAFDWRNNLHSFGLIVVSLMANQFWKPGLVRGLGTACVTLGLTFLLVRYGLMEFTNFRISGIAYLYEGYAASLLASPKAYIILVATAFVASYMNLRYAWEFGGILIPALIALQWYQPLKVATSFLEAFVIYGLGALALRAPFFADVTMEGARKVLLFFNISFAYKLALGWAAVLLGLEVKQSDLFGFGYLLATLMAIKMYEKAMLLRFTRSTLQISLVGAAVGTAAGFLLLFAPASLGPTAAEPRAEAVAPIRRDDTALARALAQQSVAIYGASIPEGPPPRQPDAVELAAFRRAVEMLLSGEGAAEPERLARSTGLLAAAGYRLEVLQGGWLLLADAEPGRAWGSFALAPRGAAPLMLSLPDPLALPGLAAAGALIAVGQGARAIALGGRSAALSRERLVDPAALPQPIHQVFMEAALSGGLGLLELRAAPSPSLAVAGTLPRGLDAIGLGRAVGGDIAPQFGPMPEGHAQAVLAGAGFAVLRLDRPALRRLLALETAVTTVTDTRGVGALLLERLSEPDAIARAGTGAYQPPSLAELRYLDAEVLTPLLQEALPDLSRIGASALAPVAHAASALGYDVAQVRSGREDGPVHALLTEAAPRRHWGTYAFRAGGDAAPFAVQVPRPLAEVNALEFGLALHDGLDAAAMLVAGADPRARPDRAADPLYPQAPPGTFNLVAQVLVREAGEAPLMTVQARALGVPREGALPPEDALLALDRTPLEGTAPPGPLAARLLGGLDRLGLSVRVVDGSAVTAGYGLGWSAPALYLAQSGPDKRVAVIWISPLARQAFAQRSEARLEAAQFEALGIPTVEATPASILAAAQNASAGAMLPAGLRAAIAEYVARRDILALRAAQRAFPALRFRRIANPEGRQTFLLVTTEGGAPLALANLTPLEPSAVLEGAGAVGRFVETRAGWLLLAPDAAQ